MLGAPLRRFDAASATTFGIATRPCGLSRIGARSYSDATAGKVPRELL
jgi:hypothetical protein